MTTTITRHRSFPAPVLHRPRHRRAMRLLAALVVVAAVGLVAAFVTVRYLHDDARRQYLARDGWPAHGQAAYAIGSGAAHVSPDQHPVAIASVAKVMTALVVLRTPGPIDVTVTAGDVADTARRRDRGESVVPVAAGEVLSEQQALAAVLLPSANNVAVMLARRVAGSVPAFVTRMNSLAQRLGLRHTRYTDPSGFSASTRSTAGDQLRLALVAMRNPVFRGLVGLGSYRLPVAGVVHTTDVLLGHNGFVGIKTGSTDAALGCFVFRAERIVAGRHEVITGAVLGQPGHNLVLTGQYAAKQLVDRLSG